MLKENWISDHLIDFEYKKYMLLAYFKEIETNFKQVKLYPFAAELELHYRNLLDFQNKKNELSACFDKEIVGLDFQKKEVIYKQKNQTSGIIKELQAIADYSLPRFKFYLQEAMSIKNMVNKSLTIFPVGLEPLYKMEGYFFINYLSNKTNIYRYNLSLFEGNDNNTRHVHFNYVSTTTTSVGNTHERIKENLIYTYRDLPNPATYCIATKLEFPEKETLLPVVSTVLSKYIDRS